MKNNNAEAFYEANDDFRKYVDRYSNTYKISVEEALCHVIVQNVMEYYKSEHGGN